MFAFFAHKSVKLVNAAVDFVNLVGDGVGKGLVKVVDAYAVEFYDFAWDAYHRGVGWYFLKHDGARADFGISAHGERSQNFAPALIMTLSSMVG